MAGSWDGMINTIIAALAGEFRGPWDGTVILSAPSLFSLSFQLRYWLDSIKAIRETENAATLHAAPKKFSVQFSLFVFLPLLAFRFGNVKWY